MDDDIFWAILAMMMFGVPIMAISLRLALRPIVEAVIRLRESFVAQPRLDPDQTRRIAALETEVDDLARQLRRMESVEEFDRQLRSGPRDS